MNLLLANRDYRIFFPAVLGANLGFLFITVPQDWVLLKIAGSAAGATGLVAVLFLLLGGILGDRCQQIRLLSTTLIWPGVATALIGLLLQYAELALWHLILVSLLTLSAFSMREPVRAALLPQLVDRSELVQANGGLEINIAVARIVAPLAGTYCYEQFGIEVVYVIGSTVTILSGLLLLRIPLSHAGAATEPASSTRPPDGTANAAGALRSMTDDLKSALLYLKSAPLPQFSLGIILLMSALCYPMITLISVVVEENLQAGVTEFARGSVVRSVRWPPALYF